jgi:hypothetical protein
MKYTPGFACKITDNRWRNVIAKLSEHTEFGCNWFSVLYGSPPSRGRIKGSFQPLFYMKYRLWKSPDGYRHTGTRLRELRNLFETGITARAILEPLLSCHSEANAIEVAKILLDKDFDVAGVQESPDGHVIGFVFRDSLKDGIVRNHLNKMTAECLISDSTPLASLLSIFKTKEYVFVLMGRHVEGIITRADLNKPPVRVYLFGLISLLEMHLTYWIKRAYPTNEDWKGKLSDNRLKKAGKLLSNRQSQNLETDLVDCLQFCDKRELIVIHEIVPEQLVSRGEEYCGGTPQTS